MRGGDLFVSILNEVQVFDQQIAPARAVRKQIGDLMRGPRIDLSPLRDRTAAATSLSGMFEPDNFVHIMVCHETRSPLLPPMWNGTAKSSTVSADARRRAGAARRIARPQ